MELCLADTTAAAAGPTGGRPGGAAGGGGVRAQVQVTVAATTLLGLDDEPGELGGYGPIPAEMARRLAADGTWRRLLTDPASGRFLDYGRRTYRPPADLADFVRARDVTCRFPTCRQPPAACDLDHVTPYPAGTTADPNLAPRCRRHHRLKHHPGWDLRRNRDGSYVWTTPTGHHHHHVPPEHHGPAP